MAASEEVAKLNLSAVIGFGGRVPGGLLCHPDGVHIMYPLGSTIVLKNTVENTQAFLQGHSDKVTCLALSHDGKYLASGQQTNMGFKSPVIVWDVDAGIRNANTGDSSGEEVQRLELHKVRVQSLSFSPDGRFLASLGGQDDNNLVVWDLDAGKPVCGSPASSHAALTVRFFNNRSDRLVTAGQYNMRIWEFDEAARKLRPNDCNLGQLKRIIQCIAIDDTDSVAYCGTKTGDVLEVSVVNGRFSRASKNRFSLGVSSITCLRGQESNHVVVGNGDGSVARLDTQRLAVRKAAQLMGSVTSVSLNPDATRFFAGTDQGNLYVVPVESFEAQLRSTAHFASVNDIVFPEGSSDIFVTCSQADVRVWNARTRKELLRIKVPNVTCNCVAVMSNGRSIVTGWDDGKIRGFYPESGKLQFVITDAHAESVTAIACTHDSSRIVSGGQDGRVRVWNVEGRTQIMEMSFKEHKRQVNFIKLNADDSECVSASADGSCIVWNLRRGVRTNALFASTIFTNVQYHPDESQLLTCGSDRKIGYWDASDCTAIRIIEGSTAEINAMDIEPEGVMFVSGGKDKLVKVWLYDEGINVAVGRGHSAGVTAMKISPDQKRIVSVGEEGAIFVWDMPSEVMHELQAEAGAGTREEVNGS